MKALEYLFTDSISKSGYNYQYKSSRHDLSFFSLENNIYFILSENNDKCLFGTIEIKDKKMVFKIDKSSSWLLPDIEEKQAINMLYDTFNFMTPVVNRKYKV